MTPVLSVGLPVYNGARHLACALDSILRQSYTDFELIISDNASTDETPEICERYLRQDARVRYFRQRANMGVARNWNFVVEHAHGSFFKWASANDYCASPLLAQCTDVLQQNPDIVLCYSRTYLIDDSNNILALYEGDVANLAERPSDRYKRTRATAAGHAQMGVIRLDLLRRTRLVGNYPGSDSVLLAELALFGPFWLLPEVLFYRRMSKGSASKFLTPSELRRFFDPLACHTKRYFPVWRLHAGFITAILRSPVSAPEKLRCLQAAARHAYWDRERLRNEVRASLPQLRRGGKA